MLLRLALLLVWLAAAGGCALAPPRLPAQAQLPADAREHPERYVVVTVRSWPIGLNATAASTPRGYSGAEPYRASEAAMAAAARIAATHRLREVASWPIDLLKVHCLVYTLPPGAQAERVLAALSADPDVESAQPLLHFVLRAAAYNDPYAGLQRNLIEMDVPAAHRSTRGEGVRVAVIDTGVDTTHPDFGGRVAAARDFVSDAAAAPEGQTRSVAAERHGTAVAGVIAAVPDNGIGIAGIAPAARLHAYRACWSSADGGGACNTFTLALALAAAVEARAAVINLSLGGPNDPLLERLVERGRARGIVFVAAVPPGGRREQFPSGIEGVIAVDVAGRSERERGVLYAPGTDVFTLAPQGRYDAVSGSSLAAAQVSALAALLLAARPGLEPKQVEAALLRSAAVAATAGARAQSVNACAALHERPDRGAAAGCRTAAALAEGR